MWRVLLHSRSGKCHRAYRFKGEPIEAMVYALTKANEEAEDWVVEKIEPFTPRTREERREHRANMYVLSPQYRAA